MLNSEEIKTYSEMLTQSPMIKNKFIIKKEEKNEKNIK